jgi:formate hydrogenlyase subunit 4
MVLNAFLLLGAQSAAIVLIAPLLTGIVRKTKARLTARRGASIFQPYRDLARLFRKESVVADGASWLFLYAPPVIFAFTWIAASAIPVLATRSVASQAADLLTIVGLVASARFVLALAGLDIGTSFGGIGASREVMIASIAEPAMLMAIFAVALVARSTKLDDIAAFVLSPAVGLRISLALALFALIMIAIAENGRVPVDNPATHLELTMVHEAMVLEYSGWRLALIELSASLKLVAYVSLIACAFVPWGMASPDAAGERLVLAAAAWFGKLSIAGILLGFFEITIAKMRVFRVPQFLGAAVMLGLLSVLLRLVSRSL